MKRAMLLVASIVMGYCAVVNGSKMKVVTVGCPLFSWNQGAYVVGAENKPISLEATSPVVWGDQGSTQYVVSEPHTSVVSYVKQVSAEIIEPIPRNSATQQRQGGDIIAPVGASNITFICGVPVDGAPSDTPALIVRYGVEFDGYLVVSNGDWQQGPSPYFQLTLKSVD